MQNQLKSLPQAVVVTNEGPIAFLNSFTAACLKPVYDFGADIFYLPTTFYNGIYNMEESSIPRDQLRAYAQMRRRPWYVSLSLFFFVVCIVLYYAPVSSLPENSGAPALRSTHVSEGVEQPLGLACFLI